MKTLILLSLCCACATGSANAQGTLVFDQESSSDETGPIAGPAIQFYGTVGQSFTPSLPGVGFVRLRLGDITPGNSLGATLAVNLRADAINGPILGTTTPVSLEDGFLGSVNFFFPNEVMVNPNATYFLETVIQSGDTWAATVLGDSYLGGIFYGGPQPATGNDLWFREGIVVPEPSTGVLLAGGVAVLWLSRRKR